MPVDKKLDVCVFQGEIEFPVYFFLSLNVNLFR